MVAQESQGDPDSQAQPGGESRWGTHIDSARADWLRLRLESSRPGPSNDVPSRSPFDGATLTGADVYWLAIQALSGPGGDSTAAERRLLAAHGNPLLQVSLDFSNLDLRRVVLSGAHLEGAILGRVRLDGATLGAARLDNAFLGEARLEGALLDRAVLEKSFLSKAHLEHASLWAASLSGASLYEAHLDDSILHLTDLRDADLRACGLDRTDLSEANLGGANLSEASLQDATLYEANLEGSVFTDAALQGCDMRRATLTTKTRLNKAHLNGAAVDQASLGETNLAVVDWQEVSQLGDQLLARHRRAHVVHYAMNGKRELKDGKRKSAQQRAEEYRAAGRAYRSLSVVLGEQGLARVATRFHYRAEVMTRKALYFEARTRLNRFSWRIFTAPGLYFVWLLSLALSVFAGYGVYHVWRLFLTYAAVVVGFAAGYYLVGQQPHMTPSLLDALVLSLTSFHGRGLAPAAGLTDTMRALAGGEAVLGLFIEGLFIAAFTRRVTGI